jgi:mevalonate pyrophosphate decarboxylase
METSVTKQPMTLEEYRMKKENKSSIFRNNNDFKAFYTTLTRDEKSFLKNSIIDECQISSAIFHNWTRSTTPIPDAFKTIIEEIAAQKIFSVDKNTSSIDVNQ